MDNFTEYEYDYVFGSTEDEGFIGPGPIIVMKDNGEVFPAHTTDRDLGEKVAPSRLFSVEALSFDGED